MTDLLDPSGDAASFFATLSIERAARFISGLPLELYCTVAAASDTQFGDSVAQPTCSLVSSWSSRAKNCSSLGRVSLTSTCQASHLRGNKGSPHFEKLSLLQRNAVRDLVSKSEIGPEARVELATSVTAVPWADVAHGANVLESLAEHAALPPSKKCRRDGQN